MVIDHQRTVAQSSVYTVSHIPLTLLPSNREVATVTRISFDTETYQIQSGQPFPRLVCLTWVEDGGDPQGLSLKEGAVEMFESWLDAGHTLVSHNGAGFDLGVMVAAGVTHSKVWAALKEGRIKDTWIQSQMQAIARDELKFNPRLKKRPTFSLAELELDLLGVEREGKKGPDVWRLRYHELEGVPFHQYPQAAKDYALADAVGTDRVYLALDDEPADTGLKILSQYSLALTSARGMVCDLEAVETLEKSLRAEVTEAKEKLKAAGLLKKSGSKDMAAIYSRVRAAFEAQGKDAPQTAKQREAGSDKTKADTETLRESDDPMLGLLADISNSDKLLSTYVPLLKSGTAGPLHPRYYLAETGRTTCRNPNVQNQPRKGGVRECFVPRQGWWYLAADYHVAELASLAQVLLDLFGHSEMAEAVKRGEDLHILAAAQMLNLDYKEAYRRHKAGDKQLKDTRQLMKALNFGLPGGLGPQTFVTYANTSWGLDIDFDQAKSLKDAWLGWWPEMRLYFDEIGRRVELGGGRFTATQHRSGRQRGGLTYCNGCNTYFQGLTADGARLALASVTEECFVKTDSPLYGCRPVAFIHDEIMLECPADLTKARAAAKRLTEVMVRDMQVFTPDVPSKADAHLMERWYKGAEPTFDEDGGLVPWRPKDQEPFTAPAQ